MALVLENISAHRGAFTIRLPHFEAAAGEVVGICGPSGCGKSTLFDLISGFLPLDSGEIRLGAKRLDVLPPEKRGVALIFQKGLLFPHLSVRENVEYPLRIRGVSKSLRRQRAMEWLERMQLSALSERRSHELSGGQAQRVSIARALITDFPILLLDEPMTGLDKELEKELESVLFDEIRKKGIYALWISHDPEQWKRFSMCYEAKLSPSVSIFERLDGRT